MAVGHGRERRGGAGGALRACLQREEGWRGEALWARRSGAGSESGADVVGLWGE